MGTNTLSKLIKRNQVDGESVQRFDFGGAQAGKDEIRPFFDAAPPAGPAPPSAPKPGPASPPKPADQERLVLETQRRAYEEGFQKGEKAGVQMGEAKLKALLDRFEELFREIDRCKERLFREAEADVISFGLELARKVVQRAVRVDEDIIRTIVQIGLQKVGRRSRVRIRLHPSDLGTLTRNGEFLDRFRSEFETLELTADEGIDQGGCLIETSSGIVDARLGTQFDEIEGELRQLLPRLD